MESLYKIGCFLLVVSLLPLAACQRPLSKSNPSPEYKVTRLRRKKPYSACYVFGCIYQRGPTGAYQPIGGCVMVDKEVILCTGSDGCYGCFVTPGQHQLQGSYLGSLLVRVNHLELQQGDSIRVDFHLQDDPRPIHD